MNIDNNSKERILEGHQARSDHSLLWVGLTGPIGAGKSVVSTIFSDLGAAIIDADHLAREAVLPGTIGLAKIISTFGVEILHLDGTLDRSKLANIIFDNTNLRIMLEDILLPDIHQRFRCAAQQFETQTPHPPFIVYSAPLLLRPTYPYQELDLIVSVTASTDTRLKRIQARDKCSKEDALRRIAVEVELNANPGLTEININNDGSLAKLQSQVATAYQQILTTHQPVASN